MRWNSGSGSAVRKTKYKDDNGEFIKEGDIIDRGDDTGIIVFVENEGELKDKSDNGFYFVSNEKECTEKDHKGKTPYDVWLDKGVSVDFDKVKGKKQNQVIGNVFSG